MCEHCGCTSDNEESRHRRMHEQGIPHEHEHRLTVEQNILSLNNSRAAILPEEVFVQLTW